jgi:hypothetical protein
VQIWFAGGKKHRDYIIFYQPPNGNAYAHLEGHWRAHSLADVADPEELDLRNRDDAQALEETLRKLDLTELEKGDN